MPANRGDSAEGAAVQLRPDEGQASFTELYSRCYIGEHITCKHKTIMH